MVTVEKDAYKSLVVKSDGANITLSEGNPIEFVAEFTGEKKVGMLTKITGKGDKTKIQVMPKGCQYEEIWSIGDIEEDTLKFYVEEE